MDKLIKEQIKLFEKILNRELSKDEKYLIGNSFLNGYEIGKKDAINAVTKLVNSI